MTPSPPGILLDIEGTTSSISYVFDVMFPYVRREIDTFLETSWDASNVQTVLNQIAQDAGHASLAAWTDGSSGPTAQRTVVAEVIRLMDDDVKATGLKQLQGLIWQAGFESGELQAHIYPDVLPALTRWKAAGQDIRIYSSGSIRAQKLFFGHTVEGDLLPYLSGHYDTTTGPKQDAESYRIIAQDFSLAAGDIVFFSDVPAELDAARRAGMITRLCCRPGNPVAPDECDHIKIDCFPQSVQTTS